MMRAYDVVDADGHILEPLDLWDTYGFDPHARIVDMDGTRCSPAAPSASTARADVLATPRR